VRLAALACAALLYGCASDSGLSAQVAAANLIQVQEPPVAEAAAAEAHAKLCGLPALIAERSAIEGFLRPTPMPIPTAERDRILQVNAGFWTELASTAKLKGAPSDLSGLNAPTSVRDFLALGALASFRVQKEGSEEAWNSWADAYEAALRIAESGGIVHLEAAHEVITGLQSNPLPAPPSRVKDRLKALAEEAPSAEGILEREHLSRASRFAREYRNLVEADLSTPEVRSYALTPKQPIFDARSEYWTAWAKAPLGQDGPERPEALTGLFEDDTESPDAMRSYREHAEKLKRAGLFFADLGG
jgi:hypothetical protein